MIPKEIFLTYEVFADAMITDLGTDCLIKYPPTPVNTAINVPDFKYSKTLRPYAQNPQDTFIHDQEQIKASDSETSIRMRVYWTPKEFQKIGGLVYPEATVQTIGYYSDITKILGAIELWPDHQKGFCLVPVGNPVPWGLRKSRYFVAFWKQK